MNNYGPSPLLKAIEAVFLGKRMQEQAEKVFLLSCRAAYDHKPLEYLPSNEDALPELRQVIIKALR